MSATTIGMEFCLTVTETIKTLMAAVVRRIATHSKQVHHAIEEATGLTSVDLSSPSSRADVADDELFVHLTFPNTRHVLTLWSRPGHGITVDYTTPDMVQAVMLPTVSVLMVDFNYAYQVLEHLGMVDPDRAPRAVLRGYIKEARCITKNLMVL